MVNPAHNLRYRRHNPKGFVMGVYANMFARVVGRQRHNAHLYEGLAILPRYAFYAWALAKDSPFWPLWHAYQAAGCPEHLAPSPDRLDSTLGYVLDNLRWLPFGENRVLGNTSLKRRRKAQERRRHGVQ